MQLLTSRTAFERLRDRLLEIQPGLEVLTLEKDGSVQHAGAVVPPAEVDADIAWMSSDMASQKLTPKFLELLGHATRTQWCQLANAGLDSPVYRKLMERGLRLTKGNGQATAIAEYVIAHAFSLLHPIATQARAQANGVWQRTPFKEIGDTRWLVVGAGSIGTEIARRMRPFGTHLTSARRSQQAAEAFDETITIADLKTVLPDSDVVVLACALNDQTRGLANAAFFAAMKPGAVLINIARGPVIDEAALREGLARSQPATAVLDVFDVEPLPADNWMWAHQQVRVTAHTSNAGNGTSGRQDSFFLENFQRYVNGAALLNEASRTEVGLPPAA